MEFITVNQKRMVNIGTQDILYSLYSTIFIRLKNCQKDYPLAMEFLKRGKSEGLNKLEVARQINLIRDALSQVSPSLAISDMRKPEEKASWLDNYSPVVTSCANLYTTADGKDLLYEIVTILVYAHYCETDVVLN